MSWPPREQEWYEILRDLPPDADRVAVRVAIEAAVRVYVETADRDQAHHDLWEHFENIGGRQNFQKLLELVGQLSTPDPIAQTLIDGVNLLRQSYSIADIEGAIYLPTNRHEQFLASLSLAWTGPGKGELPKSESGPFVDFMYRITELVQRNPLEGSGVKEFVRRELKRRAALDILKGVWSMHGQGAVKSAAFLTDAFGQRKPD
jgi:hypothetical protein